MKLIAKPPRIAIWVRMLAFLFLACALFVGASISWRLWNHGFSGVTLEGAINCTLGTLLTGLFAIAAFTGRAPKGWDGPQTWLRQMWR
jgi:hypothetical protein